MFAPRTTRVLIVGVAAIASLVWTLAWTPGAWAWGWPADGPVLRPYSLGDDPYAGGQHRGVDIGIVDAAAIRAPASGQVTFAGQVPTHGLTVTIVTSDGDKASLTHVGRLLVKRGAQVAEGDPVAESGPSGEAEHDTPYVHLGVRTGSSETYVDPLTLLPARSTPPPPAPVPSNPPAAPAPVPSSPPAPPAASPASPPAATTPAPSPNPVPPPNPSPAPSPSPSAVPSPAPSPVASTSPTPAADPAPSRPSGAPDAASPDSGSAEPDATTDPSAAAAAERAAPPVASGRPRTWAVNEQGIVESSVPNPAAGRALGLAKTTAARVGTARRSAAASAGGSATSGATLERASYDSLWAGLCSPLRRSSWIRRERDTAHDAEAVGPGGAGHWSLPRSWASVLGVDRCS